MPHTPLTVTTYNMHKGMSPLNRKLQLAPMAEALRGLQSDILFLQEVQGEHRRRAEKIRDFPRDPHYRVLAEQLALQHSYGQNATYEQRHHGNAILSRLPLATRHNLDLSVNRLEQRGLLHAEIRPHDWPQPLVCLCAHLNLRERDRSKQYLAIFDYIRNHIAPNVPLILAGDFNDWRHRSCDRLAHRLGLREAFVAQGGGRPKTFPARLPLLSLDRIYVRHLDILDVAVHNEAHWQQLSDHLPLSATVRLPER